MLSVIDDLFLSSVVRQALKRGAYCVQKGNSGMDLDKSFKAPTNYTLGSGSSDNKRNSKGELALRLGSLLHI